MTETLTRDAFAVCIGSSFRLCPDQQGGFDLLLDEVSELKTAHGFESFSLIFRSPESSMTPQATYPLLHEKLGAMDIFLVPVKQDESGAYYEAVFNRIQSLKEDNSWEPHL
jgi:hypothetical protein